MTTLKRICICSPYYSPLPCAAAMLAATPFPRGSGANLAVTGFVVGTHSDQLLLSSHSSLVPAMGGESRFERALVISKHEMTHFQSRCKRVDHSIRANHHQPRRCKTRGKGALPLYPPPPQGNRRYLDQNQTVGCQYSGKFVLERLGCCNFIVSLHGSLIRLPYRSGTGCKN